jgi:hypothetical protein
MLNLHQKVIFNYHVKQNNIERYDKQQGKVKQLHLKNPVVQVQIFTNIEGAYQTIEDSKEQWQLCRHEPCY